MARKNGSSISNGSVIEQIGCFSVLGIVLAIAGLIVYAVVFV